MNKKSKHNEKIRRILEIEREIALLNYEKEKIREELINRIAELKIFFKKYNEKIHGNI